MKCLKHPSIDGVIEVNLEEMIHLRNKSIVFADYDDGWIALINGLTLLILPEVEEENEQETKQKS
ncbi:MAG: hypothetical protein ACTSSD_19595 [Candidatus Thorarchaeota archaeon]